MGQPQRTDIAARVGQAAGRLSTDKALRKRLLRASTGAARSAMGGVFRVLRKLWLEMTGFLFICLAVIIGAEGLRKWHTHETRKLVAAAAFAVMFAYFGVTSFWKARRKLTAEAQRTQR